MPSIIEAQQELTDAFAMFDDWMDKYQYIIDLGAELPEMPAELKIDDNVFHGCQSLVWLTSATDGDKLRLQAASDSAIVRGLIYMLLSLYNGRSAREILENPPEFINTVGLQRHLSPNRSTGLAAMVGEIRRRAALILSLIHI